MIAATANRSISGHASLPDYCKGSYKSGTTNKKQKARNKIAIKRTTL